MRAVPNSAGRRDSARIAIFMSTSGHSGVDRAVKNLIPALARRGYAVDLLQVRKHGPNLTEIPPGVRIIDTGASTTYLALPALVRYLRRERPAVLLSDKDRVNRTALFARALAAARATRLILSSGTTISIDLQHRGFMERWLQRNSMGRLYPFADKVIVTSRGVADDMTRYTGLAREHIEVVPSPVVPDALFRTSQALPDHPWYGEAGTPIILGVGELGMRKDFVTLLRAFAQLRRQRPCRLMILGKGNQREHLLKLSTELGVAQDFALPGYQPNPYAFMAHAAVLACTSRWEGLGFVIIEALAVGTPVVATDCPSGPAEILQGGRYGPLVPVGDVDALARALQTTLAHRPPKPVLQEAALPYEIERSTDAYLRVFGLPAHREAPTA